MSAVLTTMYCVLVSMQVLRRKGGTAPFSDCGQFMHLNLKHKGPLVFESWDNNRKSEVDLIYKNNAIFM